MLFSTRWAWEGWETENMIGEKGGREQKGERKKNKDDISCLNNHSYKSYE